VPVETVAWTGEAVRLVDQTRLPGELAYIDCRDVESLWEAIRSLRVRGAPAIGVAAAFGACLAAIRSEAATGEGLLADVEEGIGRLASSRPTAVNLFWALERMRRAARTSASAGPDGIRQALLAEAQSIQEEDRRACRRIGENGRDLIKPGANVLTHCNAGGLATSEYGTALAVMFAAREAGTSFHVYVDETRPLLQGARLTAWELQHAGIPATVICDNMAGSLMRAGSVDLVIVGADRITANGDTANKIGTYSLAVLAAHHDVPFYIAAPLSTIDPGLSDGRGIPIEERPGGEISMCGGVRTVPEGVAVYNPAFDVTPADLISGIVTEVGVLRAPYGPSIAEALRQA